MKNNQKRQEWLEARVAELMGLEVDEALAALPAPLPDAELIQMAHHNGSNLAGATYLTIQEIRAAGVWDDHARQTQTAILQAIIEQATQDAVDGLGRNPYQLPIPEIARRAAAVEIAVAAGDEPEQVLAVYFEAIFGRRAKVASWRCPNGHGGYTRLEDAPLAIDPCPFCGQLLSRWQRLN